MQDENRGLWRGGVDLVERRQPLFDELVAGEAADDAHPLRRRRILSLGLQHGHGVGQAGYAVPAELHVVVQPAADEVGVAIDQARHHPPAAQVHDLCQGACGGQDFVRRTHSGKEPVLDRHGVGARVRSVQSSESTAA
ncbi:hypothetical protein D3C73_765460 [compost metagenome]